MFKELRSQLLNTQKGKYYDCSQNLKYLRTVGVLYEALLIYEPEQVKAYVEAFSVDMFRTEEVANNPWRSNGWEFNEHVINTLGKIIKIEEDISYENLEDGGIVYIEPLAPAMNYDEYNEALTDFGWDVDPVDMFVQVMFHGCDAVTEEEKEQYYLEHPESEDIYDTVYTWNDLNQRFEWNYPRDPSTEVHWTDWNKFIRLCQLLDLECFYHMVRVLSHDGDSAYITYNPSDETAHYNSYGEYYGEVTLSQIQFWREQYELAMPFFNQYLAGWRILREDNHYYRVLMYLLKQCNMTKEAWFAKYRPNEDPSRWF